MNKLPNNSNFIDTEPLTKDLYLVLQKHNIPIYFLDEVFNTLKKEAALHSVINLPPLRNQD